MKDSLVEINSLDVIIEGARRVVHLSKVLVLLLGRVRGLAWWAKVVPGKV